MIVYHGSTLEIKNPDVKHSKSSLDFGKGFYVTSFSEQALVKGLWTIYSVLSLLAL